MRDSKNKAARGHQYGVSGTAAPDENEFGAACINM